MHSQPFFDSFCTQPARSPTEKFQLSATQKYKVASAAISTSGRTIRLNMVGKPSKSVAHYRSRPVASRAARCRPVSAFHSGRFSYFVLALKLVKMRVCTRRMSCGTASGEVTFFEVLGTEEDGRTPGDVVVVDRNCHKSILHTIIMTGAVPVFLTPTRNHFGIIGPIPQAEFLLEAIRRKIAANPLLAGVDPDNVRPRILTLTQSTYDGVLYNTETIKHSLDGYIDTLHFDEAWLPHAAFHPFYGSFTPWARSASGRRQLVFATQSTHKLLAGISQASQVLVQDAQSTKLDRHLFNEAYLMHTSTSPQYAIIASCDVAAAMMEPPGGRRWWRRASRSRWTSAAPCARSTRSSGRRLVVQGLGPGRAGRRRHRPQREWVLKASENGTALATWPRASTCSTRSSARSLRPGWTWTAV